MTSNSAAITLADMTTKRINLTWAATIRELRQKFGDSQEAFAARLNISQPYLSQLETGDRPLLRTPLMIVLTNLARTKGVEYPK